MSITVHSPTWTADPSILASGLTLAGAIGAWLLGRVLAFLGLNDEARR